MDLQNFSLRRAQSRKYFLQTNHMRKIFGSAPHAMYFLRYDKSFQKKIFKYTLNYSKVYYLKKTDCFREKFLVLNFISIISLNQLLKIMRSIIYFA